MVVIDGVDKDHPCSLMTQVEGGVTCERGIDGVSDAVGLLKGGIRSTQTEGWWQSLTKKDPPWDLTIPND